MQKNWFEAQRHCRFIEMFMVDLIDDKKTQTIEKLLKDTHNNLAKNDYKYWIGANNVGNNKCFFWESNGQPVIHSNYVENLGERDKQFRCVVMTGKSDLKWERVSCVDLNYYICEKKNYCKNSNENMKSSRNIGNDEIFSYYDNHTINIFLN